MYGLRVVRYAMIDTVVLDHQVLAVFDTDGDGQIQFSEFLNGLSIFCKRDNPTEKLKCMLVVCVSGWPKRILFGWLVGC
jgi:hypothetical protein